MKRFLQKYVLYSAHLSRLVTQRSLVNSRFHHGAKFIRWSRDFQQVFCYFRRQFRGPSPANHFCRHYYSKHGKKNYYRILGISPKASQAQIKDAYYTLSMKHHPDRHKGSGQPHDMFQEISEAYSVLGNYDQRKQYDRGLIVQGALAPEHARAGHAPAKRTGSIYDFDEWTKQHYFQALKRRQRDKRERMEDEVEKSTHKVQEGTLRLVVMLLTLVIVVIFSSTGRMGVKEGLIKQEGESK